MKNKNSNVKYFVAGPLVVAVILTIAGVSMAQYQGGMGRGFHDQHEERNYNRGFDDSGFNGGMDMGRMMPMPPGGMGGMDMGRMMPMPPGGMGGMDMGRMMGPQSTIMSPPMMPSPPRGGENFMPQEMQGGGRPMMGPGPMMGGMGGNQNPFSFGGRIDERNLSNFFSNFESTCDELEMNFDEQLAGTFSSECTTAAEIGERYETSLEEFENMEEELKSSFEEDGEKYVNPKFMRELMKQMKKLEKDNRAKIKGFIKEVKTIKKSVDQKWKIATKEYGKRQQIEMESMKWEQNGSQYSGQQYHQPMHEEMPIMPTSTMERAPTYPDSRTGSTEQMQ